MYIIIPSKFIVNLHACYTGKFNLGDDFFLIEYVHFSINFAIIYFCSFQNNVYHYRILQDTNRRFLFEVSSENDRQSHKDG